MFVVAHLRSSVLLPWIRTVTPLEASKKGSVQNLARRSSSSLVLGPSVFGLRRWRREWVELSRSAAADRHAWRGPVRDVIEAEHHEAVVRHNAELAAKKEKTAPPPVRHEFAAELQAAFNGQEQI
ncbi:hypothetical protein SprV_0902660400 [Sparganum proliferum]